MFKMYENVSGLTFFLDVYQTIMCKNVLYSSDTS